MMKNNIIGNNLYHARKYLDLTIEQVANILDISLQEVKDYECGSAIPDSEMIIKFSKLYGILCIDILTEHNFNMSKDEKVIAELIKFKSELNKHID